MRQGVQGVTLRQLEEERGVALIIALLVLTFLSVMGSAFLLLATTEGTLAMNERRTTAALSLAEAGAEAAWQQIRSVNSTAELTTLFAAAITSNLGGGTYTVQFSNDPGDPGGANDTNGTVIVISTGTVEGVSQVVEMAVSRFFVPLPPSAVGLPGNEANSSFSGNAFKIDGHDTNPDDTPGSDPVRPGISVPNAARKNEVTSALQPFQYDNVDGLGMAPGQSPSVTIDNSLTSAQVTNLANQLAQFCPTVTVVNGQQNYSFGTYASGTSWGTPTNPGIFCFEGAVAGNAQVKITGNSQGAGILIAKNADLVFAGNVRWEGLIIVTGDLVGFGIMGGGNQYVYGGILINETSADGPGFREEVFAGNAKVRFSRKALENAGRSKNLYRVLYYSQRTA